METLEFLRAVWPAQGHYCIAQPSPSGNGYIHKIFARVEDAAQYVASRGPTHNIFFCVHALKETRVWNARREKWSHRTQANMRAARAFFFDLDVGEDASKKYATQGDALADLKRFITLTQLPRPMIVTSGGGLHLYWPVEDEIPSDQWAPVAQRLHALARHYKLRVDPSRTTDTASVLRVVGTFNQKTDPPRPVYVLYPGGTTDNDEFVTRLDAALDAAGVQVTVQRPLSPVDTVLGSNMTTEFDGPPVTLQQLGSACAQVRHFAKLRGNVDYAAWHKMLNLIRFVQDGRKWAHELSKGHPDYDPAETDAKLDDQEDAVGPDGRPIGPTTCDTIASVCGEARCQSCPFRGVRSPMTAARTPKPAAQQTPDPVQLSPEAPPITVINKPNGFYLSDEGDLMMKKLNDKGVADHIRVMTGDLYPLRRQVDETAETDQHLWCKVLPHEEPKHFTMSSGLIQETAKLAVELSRHGVYVDPRHTKSVQIYMSAYIQSLQKAAAAEVQHTHLGWVADRTEFILPDKRIRPDGSVIPIALSSNAQHFATEIHHVGKKGTLARQIELMTFYDTPFYRPHQFFICGAFAAPIFFATGLHGAIVNASGLPGSSKSTALYTAGSVWGHPEKYPLNATNGGATLRARDAAVTTLANLPIGLDEITHMAPDDAKDFAMNVSQPGERIRLKQTGEVRKTTGSDKSTILLCTANNSLHSLLAIDNAAGTAGSMRVFEIVFPKAPDNEKAAADDFKFALSENYGHLGEVFIRYVVMHRDIVVNRVRQKLREIDARGQINPGERFWSAIAAATLVAGAIAFEIGLIPYNMQALEDWLITEQLPFMRGAVKDEYSTPVSTLLAFLDRYSNETILIDRVNGTVMARREPRGQSLIARYERHNKLLWIAKDRFKDFCVHRKAPYGQIVSFLEHQRIVLGTNERKVLGANSDLDKGRSYCILVDMAHPDVAAREEDLLREQIVPMAPNLTAIRGGKA